MMMMFLVIQVLFFLTTAVCMDKFSENCLNAHNYYRSKHGSPPLQWSNSLADDAQKWAEQLAIQNKLVHDYNSIEEKDQGENLAFLNPSLPKCQDDRKEKCVECSDIVKKWYSEVKNYNFANGKGNSPSSLVLHFAPVVWKATKNLGVGTAVSKKLGLITVARYSPRGNIGDPEQFKINVYPAETTLQTEVPAKGKPVPPENTSQTEVPANGKPVPPAEANNQKNATSNRCKYYLINSTTITVKVVQECQGKPNVTAVCPGNLSSIVCTEFQPGNVPPKPTSPISSPSPSKPQTTKPSLKAITLMITNLYRTRHQSQPIKWNSKIAEDAQKWATKLAKQDSGLLHQEGLNDGENLAEMEKNTNEKAVVTAVDTWYDEVSKYSFKNSTFSKDTGHFTQLIWNQTAEMGLALAATVDGTKQFVVARFRPAGNVVGKFQQNVFPIPPIQNPKS